MYNKSLEINFILDLLRA